MDRMLARYKQSGEPTLTGYLAPRGGEATQCSYDNLDALRGHMSTPDLSRLKAFSNPQIIFTGLFFFGHDVLL
jgi:hypothetical protein